MFVFHAVAVPYTWMGVDQFFVLSGYLITGNLLGLRGRGRPGAALGVFYQRRLLRIVPPYDLALIAIFVLAPVGAAVWPWYLGFASNLRDVFYPLIKGPLLPMWSIAVEEQFYLVWPFLVLLVPERHLGKVFLAAIVLAPALRLALTPISANAVYRLMPTRTDLLGLGALMAWLEHREPGRLHRHRGAAIVVGVAAAGVFAALAAALPSFELEHNSALYNTVGYSLEAVFFTAALVVVRTGERDLLTRVLVNPVLRYLGTISYTAYLIHVLVLVEVHRLHLPGAIAVALALAGTVAVASLSWFAIERPLQRFKRS
ncbi:MAG: acyltransferase [Myxococcales bacterium]|nr:acyltransferase [Myxococcales bacterium]